MHRTFLCIVLSLFLPSVVWAQTSNAPTTETTPVNQPAGIDWEKDYKKAVASLRDGRFSEAVGRLEELAKNPPGADAKLRVDTLLSIARGWATDGYTLVLNSPSIETLRARRRALRSSGEIAGLYVDSVLYGFGTGLWAANLANADSAPEYILPALGLAGAGAATVYWVDQEGYFGYGVARAASTGLRLGFLHGLLWTLWSESQPGIDWDFRVSTSIVWGASTGGAVGGAMLGHRLGVTPGAASMVESGALWTALSSALFAGGLVPDSADPNVVLLTATLGLSVGTIGAGFLAAEMAPSPARVRYIDLGGISGALLFGGLYAAFVQESGRGLALTTGTGIVLGLTTSWYLTRSMERDGFIDRSQITWRPMIIPTEAGPGLALVGQF